MKYAFLRDLFLIILGLSASTAAPGAEDTVTWLNDYDIARAHALDTGRPLLVSFRCVP